jgi:transcriptional regulator of heat shock response
MDDLMAEILKGKNPPKPINWQNKEYANLEDALKVFRDQKQDIFKQGLDPTKLTKQEADQQQARVKEAVEALEKKTETAKAEPEAEEEVSPPPPPYSKSNGLEQASEPRRSN